MTGVYLYDQKGKLCGNDETPCGCLTYCSFQGWFVHFPRPVHTHSTCLLLPSPSSIICHSSNANWLAICRNPAQTNYLSRRNKQGLTNISPWWGTQSAHQSYLGPKKKKTIPNDKWLIEPNATVSFCSHLHIITAATGDKYSVGFSLEKK